MRARSLTLLATAICLPVLASRTAAQGTVKVDFREVYGIAYTDSLTATIVGIGRIVQTTDGGVTWVERFRDTALSIIGVAFASRDTGVAVGRMTTEQESKRAVILRTTNGGRSWRRVPAPRASEGLTAVAFADGRHGVAVDEMGGAALRTSDAGATWLVLPSVTGRLESVAFTGRRGWIVGLETMLQTNDGGVTWRRAEADSEFLSSVRFLDPQHGVIAGAGLLLVTEDGGQHWTRNAPALAALDSLALAGPGKVPGGGTSFRAAALAAPGTIVAVGETGAIARSTDGGASWHLIDGRAEDGFQSVAFADARNGFAVGTDGVLRTHDGGATWVNVADGTTLTEWSRPVGTAPDLAAVPSGAAPPAAGRADTATRVGGARPDVTTPTSAFAAAVSRARGEGTRFTVNLPSLGNIVYADSLHAVLVLDHQVVQTVDGGVSWAERFRDTTLDLAGAAFATRETGVVVGTWSDRNSRAMNAVMLRTTDGGASWTRVRVPRVNAIMSGVAFADARQGVAVGWGDMLRTSDAGATWQVVRSDSTQLEQVAFAGEMGWAVGSGVTLQTSDGGAHWSRAEESFEERYAVMFSDGHHGLIAGNWGYLRVTDDGGRTWKPTSSEALAALAADAVSRGFTSVADRPLVTTFRSAALAGPRTIVAAPRIAALARSTDGGESWRLISGGPEHGFRAIAFADSLNGLAGGGDWLLRTLDGGATWVNLADGSIVHGEGNAVNPASEIAVGALTGTWSITWSDLHGSNAGGEVTCSRPAPTAITLTDDTTVTGTLGTWAFSCEGAERFTAGGFAKLKLNWGDRVVARVSGTADRLQRSIQLRVAFRDSQMTLSGSLDRPPTAHMRGTFTLVSESRDLGAVELRGRWEATRQ